MSRTSNKYIAARFTTRFTKDNFMQLNLREWRGLRHLHVFFEDPSFMWAASVPDLFYSAAVWVKVEQAHADRHRHPIRLQSPASMHCRMT